MACGRHGHAKLLRFVSRSGFVSRRHGLGRPIADFGFAVEPATEDHSVPVQYLPELHSGIRRHCRRQALYAGDRQRRLCHRRAGCDHGDYAGQSGRSGRPGPWLPEWRLGVHLRRRRDDASQPADLRCRFGHGEHVCVVRHVRQFDQFAGLWSLELRWHCGAHLHQLRHALCARRSALSKSRAVRRRDVADLRQPADRLGISADRLVASGGEQLELCSDHVRLGDRGADRLHGHHLGHPGGFSLCRIHRRHCRNDADNLGGDDRIARRRLLDRRSWNSLRNSYHRLWHRHRTRRHLYAQQQLDHRRRYADDGAWAADAVCVLRDRGR